MTTEIPPKQTILDVQNIYSSREANKIFASFDS